MAEIVLAILGSILANKSTFTVLGAATSFEAKFKTVFKNDRTMLSKAGAVPLPNAVAFIEPKIKKLGNLTHFF